MILFNVNFSIIIGLETEKGKHARGTHAKKDNLNVEAGN